jgi:hypothetical protein
MMVGFDTDEDLGHAGSPTGGALFREAHMHLVVG